MIKFAGSGSGLDLPLKLVRGASSCLDDGDRRDATAATTRRQMVSTERSKPTFCFDTSSTFAQAN